MKPLKLNVVHDYRPALLWLMDQYESIRMRDALTAFEEAFREIIPPEHREKNSSGRIKWLHYVQWARYDLVNKGLMGSGGRGIWTITLAGRQWLKTHSDQELSDWEVGAEQKGQDVKEGFRWRGQWYAIARKELLDRARTALAQNPPPEALRYRTWAVIVDKRPINIKWLFSLATGIDDYDAFDSPTARRALSQIGIQAKQMNQSYTEVQSTDKAAQDDSVTVQIPSRVERTAKRDAFLQQIITLVPQHLSDQARHIEVQKETGWNRIEWSYPEFRGATYELILGRDDDRLGIHFKAAPEHNEKRLRVFEPHREALSKKVTVQVQNSRFPNFATTTCSVSV